MGLPTDDKARKALPIFTGVMMYFPDAIAAVAQVSKVGNDQHNPGEPLHWAREKSTDQMNTAQRHMIDHGRRNLKDTDGTYHLAKAIWRLCAELQLTIEKEQAGTTLAEKPRRGNTLRGDEPCKSQAPGRRAWSCERPNGHTGRHMAWSDYASGTLYEGGSWE